MILNWIDDNNTSIHNSIFIISNIYVNSTKCQWRENEIILGREKLDSILL